MKREVKEIREREREVEIDLSVHTPFLLNGFPSTRNSGVLHAPFSVAVC